MPLAPCCKNVTPFSGGAQECIGHPEKKVSSNDITILTMKT